MTSFHAVKCCRLVNEDEASTSAHASASSWSILHSYLLICLSVMQMKCDQYWPSRGLQTYGIMHVTLLDVVELATYTIRTFLVARASSRTCSFLPTKKTSCCLSYDSAIFHVRPHLFFSDTSISSFLFAIASISFYCLLHSFVQASTDPLDYRLFLYPAWPIDFTDCGPCNRFLKILRLFFVLTMCRIDYAVHFISGDDCESTYISADIMNYVLLQR